MGIEMEKEKKIIFEGNYLNGKRNNKGIDITWIIY